MRFFFIAFALLLIMLPLLSLFIHVELLDRGIKLKQSVFMKEKFLPFDAIRKVYFEYDTSPSSMPQFVFVDKDGNKTTVSSDLDGAHTFFASLEQKGNKHMELEGVYKRRWFGTTIRTLIGTVFYFLSCMQIASWITI